MFYTLIQSADNELWEGERFVCIEADSMEDAIERTEWFGIDLQATFGRFDVPKWTWHHESCGVLYPSVNGHRIQNCSSRYGGAWVIVYKNGNLQSSLAIPLDREPDQIMEEPAEAT